MKHAVKHIHFVVTLGWPTKPYGAPHEGGA